MDLYQKFQSTGEFFGLVDLMERRYANNSQSNVSLNKAVKLAAEQMTKLDTRANGNKDELMMTVTSESTQWLFIVYRQDWVYKKVKEKKGMEE